MSRNRFEQLYRSIRSTVYEFLIAAVFIPLERLLPVDRQLWCFCTWGRYYHTLDNPRAVFEKVKNDPSIKKVVLTRGSTPPEAPIDGVNVHLIDAGSLWGMYYMARSGVVVIGYSLFYMCSYSKYLTAKHLVVQLSHGVALRSICRMCPGEEDSWAAETPLYSATICSSERDREIMMQAYAPVPAERVWITGLPRNNFILDAEEELPDDYRRTLDNLRAQIGGRRLVLYAPTWRKEAGAHYAFSQDEIIALEKLLRAHNAVLGIRGHSNVREHTAYKREHGSSQILSMNEVPDVNLLLRITDVLITDYSSIYIDFLLTQRPIVHFVYDLMEYQPPAGFLYGLKEAFGGPSAQSFPELLAHLEQALSQPAADSEQRNRARQLFHAHPANSAQVVADKIRQLADALPRGYRNARHTETRPQPVALGS
jgi:hypothetical protein